MATAAERMLALTSLSSPSTASAHFLSITQGSGPGGVVIEADKILVKVVESNIKASIPSDTINVKVSNSEIYASIEDTVINTKITQNTYKAEI